MKMKNKGRNKKNKLGLNSTLNATHKEMAFYVPSFSNKIGGITMIYRFILFFCAVATRNRIFYS